MSIILRSRLVGAELRSVLGVLDTGRKAVRDAELHTYRRKMAADSVVFFTPSEKGVSDAGLSGWVIVKCTLGSVFVSDWDAARAVSPDFPPNFIGGLIEATWPWCIPSFRCRLSA